MASVFTAIAGKLGLVKMKLYEGALEGNGRAFYDLKFKTLEGEPFSFDTLRGKAVLITNVACECGFTSSNYKQLVDLHNKYQGKLEIIGFPTNEFGGQESKGAADIRNFVTDLGVKFPMMEKSQVNGPKTNPVYELLKKATNTEKEDIKWNFETKFLVSSDGKQIARFSKAFEPKTLIPFIDQAIDGNIRSAL